MDKCQFGEYSDVPYQEFDRKEVSHFKCPNSRVNTSSGYCKFHDQHYALNHQSEIITSFNEMIENADPNSSLLLIGYQFPMKIILSKSFKEIYFTNANFRELYLLDCNFDRANFVDAEFQSGKFSNVKFKEANFSKARFNKFDFATTHFNKCEFTDGKLTNVKFTNVKCNETEFSGSKLDDVDFNEVSFNNTQFVDCDIANCNFSNVKARNVIFDFSNISHGNFLSSSFDKVSFPKARIKNIFFSTDIRETRFIYSTMENVTFGECKIHDIDFTGVGFSGETEFFNIDFPIYVEKLKDIPIKFDYSTFKGRTRFRGNHPTAPLDLGSVTFKGVDLTNVEFHNVKWIKKEGFLLSRNLIVDELLMDQNKNYEEVSRIYNQLRKNYESKLLFTEASNFFIGELEAIRKSLWKGSRKDKLSSIAYWIYKKLAMYGESSILPLVVWTPVMIIFFTVLRFIYQNCLHVTCNVEEKFVDSLAAYFQVPRSTNVFDIIERIVSAPILGSAFIAVRRKFERRK